MLPKEAIQEFKQIFLKEEGVLLTDEEAVTIANNLMGLFKELHKDTVDKRKPKKLL